MACRTRLVAVAFLLLTGCNEEARYTVRLGPREALSDGAAIDLLLLRATCAQVIEAVGIPDGGWVLRRSQWQGGQPAVDIGEIRPGRYGLIGLVRGPDCMATWGACLDIEVERGGEGSFELQLQQASVPVAACLPGEICAGGGLCGPAPACDNATVACNNDGDAFLACLPEQFPPDCDCNDDDPSIFPGAEEHCDFIDQDCNDELDPIECAACLDQCAEPGICEHATCPDGVDGDCVLATDDDGTDCEDADGPAVCCGGACDGVCTPGDTENQGCGLQCGLRTRTCGETCQWGDYGACNQSGECSPAAEQDVDCGDCGTQHEVCNDSCQWEPDGVCTGEGVCTPGVDADPVACGTCGMRIDGCTVDCTVQTGSCEPDPARAASCTDPQICCPNGSCGQQGAECCGTDTSTCGAAALCTDWTCVGGICTEGDEGAGTDPENECAGADCCNGAGACTSSC